MPAMTNEAPRPLRVMAFLHRLQAGGVERVLLRLCGAWADDPRIDVRLVLGSTAGPLAAELPPGLRRDVAPRGGANSAAGGLATVLALHRAMVAHRPDVLFAAGNTLALVAIAMRLLLGRNCPPIVLKVSNDLTRSDLPAVQRWLNRRWLAIQGRMIDHFVALAAPMRPEIMAAMRVPADRVHVIDNPALSEADLDALAGLAATRATGPARRYVAIGRLARQKNFGLLLTAFARAAAPGDTLAILGEGEDRNRLAAMITALELGKCVSMPGHSAAAPALAAADVFVLSSHHEGLPAVVIEALASGLPVVATDCGAAIRSLVSDFGTVVPPGDAAALATAMAARLRLTTGQQAAARAAMQAFTVERAAGRYAEVFAAVAAQARHAAAPSAQACYTGDLKPE